MVWTRRQQANFDEVGEEAEIYHRTDIDDTRIMMENGLEAEGIDCIMGRTNDEEEDFWKAVTRVEEGMCKWKVSE